MATKVVINDCYGGFSISKRAALFMALRGNKQAKAELKRAAESGEWYGYGYVQGFPKGYYRADPQLVAAVEALGDEANGRYAKLKVVEIPDGVEWCIEEYDGKEWIAEKHRTWS